MALLAGAQPKKGETGLLKADFRAEIDDIEQEITPYPADRSQIGGGCSQAGQDGPSSAQVAAERDDYNKRIFQKNFLTYLPTRHRSALIGAHRAAAGGRTHFMAASSSRVITADWPPPAVEYAWQDGPYRRS